MAENHHSGARRTAGLIVIFALTIAFFWKLVLTNQYSWLESPDLAHQVLPWMQYEAGELRAGHMPIWAPYEWSGQPLAGQGQASVFNPFNLALLSIPLRNGWIRMGALNWYFVILHTLAGWFMFLLCRDLHRSFFASVVAAMTFAFGGYCGMIDWPQMLGGALWAPIIWLFHLRTIRGEKPALSAVLGGAALGMSWLSGHHQAPIFLAITVAISWCFYIWKDIRNILWAAAFFGTMFLVAGAQLVPAWEYGQLARRWVGLPEPIGWRFKVPYFLHEHWGLRPLEIFGTVFPGLNIQGAHAYIGITAAAFALLGFLAGETYFAVIALGGLLYALAQFGAIGGLFYSLLPVVEKARSPAMATLIVGLGFGPMIARGLDSLAQMDTRKLHRSLVGLGCGLLAFYFIWGTVRGLDNVPDSRPMMTAIAALALAAILHSRPKGWRALTGGLIFLELTLMAPYYLPNRFDPDRQHYLNALSQHQDIVDFLRSEPQPVRVQVQDEAIPYNFGDWYGVDVYGGYLASITSNLLDLDLADSRTIEVMGVTHWIGSKPARPDDQLAFRGAKGVNVWRRPNPLPRAWIVHTVLRTTGRHDEENLKRDEAFDFRKAAYAAEEMRSQRCSGDHATLLRREASHIVVGAEANCDGVLAISELDYPGWEASVDGRPVRMVTVNGAFRGIEIGRGWHRVDYRYRPKSVMLGTAMTASGMLLVAAAFIMGRRRS